MIPIIELDRILMNWVDGARQVARCEIVFQAFGKPDLPGQMYPRLTPCVNFDYQWLFWIDQHLLLNFGANVDEEGTTSVLYAGLLTRAPDEFAWESEQAQADMRELDKDWVSWAISTPTCELLERELSLLRWNLELDEPDSRLDPRGFLVCAEDAYVLRKLSEIIKILLERLPDEEVGFAKGLLEMLDSVPNVSGNPVHTDRHSGKKYYIWDPACRLEGIVTHKESGFSCEVHPTGLILEWEDYRSTSWTLRRGQQGGCFDDTRAVFDYLHNTHKLAQTPYESDQWEALTSATDPSSDPS